MRKNLLVVFSAAAFWSGLAVAAEPGRNPTEEQAGDALDRIVFPSIHFQDANLPAAVDQLNAEAKRIDPQGWGDRLRIVIDFTARPVPELGLAGPSSGPRAESRITVDLRYASLRETLEYVIGGAGLEFRAEPGGIRVIARNAPPPMATREFRLPEEYMKQQAAKWQLSREDFADKMRQQPAEVLANEGFLARDGRTAIVDDTATRLTVHAEPEELRNLEASLKGPPPAPTDEERNRPTPPKAYTLEEMRRYALPALTRKRWKAIILPEVAFDKVPLKEVILALREISIRFDEGNPLAERGAKIRVRLSAGAAPMPPMPQLPPTGLVPGIPSLESAPTPAPSPALAPAGEPEAKRNPDLQTPVTFAAKKISLLDTIQAVAKATRCRLQWDAGVIVIGPPIYDDEVLISAEMAAAPEFTLLQPKPSGPPPRRDPYWPTSGGGAFGGGPSAVFIISSGRLILRNRPSEIDRIRETVENEWLKYYERRSPKLTGIEIHGE